MRGEYNRYKKRDDSKDLADYLGWGNKKYRKLKPSKKKLKQPFEGTKDEPLPYDYHFE